MANILTADDATFAATVGNWTNDPSIPTAITRQTSPTSPDGNNVGQLQRTGTPPGNGRVYAQIPTGIYPVVPGDEISMEAAYSAPAANAGTGTLFFRMRIVLYGTSGGGTVLVTSTSASFTKGDGWHVLTIAATTVPALIGGVTPIWAGVDVLFGPLTGSGIIVGDVAHFSDVSLDKAAVGGWAVGMVRMGAN